MADALVRVVRRLTDHLSTVSALMLLTIGAITLVDVFGRYFGLPLPGGFELIQLSMIVLIFTALPAVSFRREHVTVDIVQAVLTPGVKRIARSLVSLASLAVAGFYAVQLYDRGRYLALSAETTYNLQIAVAPFAYFISGMWALTAAVFVVNAVLDLAGVEPASPDSTDPDPAGPDRIGPDPAAPGPAGPGPAGPGPE